MERNDIKADGLFWGRISTVDDYEVTIITSRSSIERIPLVIIKGVA